MNMPPPLTIGGKYRVVRRLGQGGMGSVYEAIDDVGARVAVKVIQTELANNQTLVGRFAREARAVSAIDTPHITKSIDAGTDPLTGLPYLVMELLDGEDVDQLGQRLGPLPSGLALRIAAQACKALQKAHEAHILHRDIKPANLFLTKDLRPGAPAGMRIAKLLDFGVAKVKPEITRSHAETAGLTRTGSMLGSPLYMSPEQARGYKDIDYRSDLWSLGVVLYKMLSGRTPHDDTEELGELIVLICTEPPQPIQDLAPWVAPEIAAVVHRALRFSPAERFAGAAEMLAAIEALIGGDPTIQDGLLRPLSDAEKAYVAPRLTTDLTDAPPPRKGAITTASGDRQLPAVPSPAPSYPAGQPVYPQASTLSAGAMGSGPSPGSYGGQGQLPAAPPRSPGPWIAAAAIGALLLAGLIGAQILGVFKPSGDSGVAAPATAPPDKPRSVTVVILPPTAKVDIEGVPAQLTEGVLELTGAVGSVHKVHVVSGTVEKTVRVVVAEKGAVPAKIELDIPAGTPTSTVTTPTLGGSKPKPKPTSAPGTEPLRDER